MKKIVILLVFALAGLSSAYSMELPDYRVFYKLNNSTTFKALVRYLDANATQADQLNYVFNLTEQKLRYATRKDNTLAAEKAMKFNLGNAKSILSVEQYRKYLIVLNVSRYSSYDNIADNK